MIGESFIQMIRAMNAVPKPLEMAKMMVKQAISAGDTVVDATLGNGHDALFLAGCVGVSGKVIGFDVQQQAIDSSLKRFSDAEVLHMEFHCAGHEKMGEFVAEPLSAVMFNLGYLPSADKTIISKKETTLEAIKQAQKLLKSGGVLSVMCYPGHEGGDTESAAVVEYLSAMCRKDWRVMQYQFLNAPNQPAFLTIAEKLENKGKK